MLTRKLRADTIAKLHAIADELRGLAHSAPRASEKKWLLRISDRVRRLAINLTIGD